MASSYFKRLEKKYGGEVLRGNKYNKLIKQVVAHNNEKTSKAVLRMSNDNYKKGFERLSKEKRRVIKLPELSDVFPKRSAFLLKSAEQGNIITDSLRTDLERDLRKVLKDFEGPKMEVQRGRTTGKIKPELIKAFQERIVKTFESRTKRDPSTGVPPNVRNIAVTEVRSTIDQVRETYVEELIKKNRGKMEVVKTWIHNKGLSKKPRGSHMRLNGETIAFDAYFMVSNEQTGGIDKMRRPHDPDAPPEQVIGCSCEIVNKAIIL